MVALNKAFWPSSVTVFGKEYAVHAEHWFWMDFYRMLGRPRRPEEFDFLYDGPPPEDRQAGLGALMCFFAPASPLPREVGGDEGGPVLDYEQDEDLIYAAFMQCYGIDLKSEAVHWHKFLALLRGLGGTRLNEVMGYRSYSEADRGGYEKFMGDMKRAWRLEEPETAEEKEARDEFDRNFS